MNLFPLTNLSDSKNNVTKNNYAWEYIEMPFTSVPEFGRSMECKIARVANLITDCYVKIKLPRLGSGTRWVEDDLVGKLLIKKVLVKINDDTKEELDSDYMNIYNSLTLSCEKKRHYDNMLFGDTMYIPLKLFFNKYNANYLPIKEGHEYKICIEFEKIENLVINQNNTDLSKIRFESDPTICFNCIYVNRGKDYPALMSPIITQKVEVIETLTYCILNDEIKDQTNINLAYEYLKKTHISVFRINVLCDLIFQYLGYPDTRAQKTYKFAFDLDFKLKCKELWWIICPVDKPLRYMDIIQSARITFNGYDRFSEQESRFFTNYQQWKHHTNHVENVHVYSFCSNPESNECDGWVDFEIMDERKLHLTVLCPFDNFYNLKIYGIQSDNFVI